MLLSLYLKKGGCNMDYRVRMRAVWEDHDYTQAEIGRLLDVLITDEPTAALLLKGE